MPKQKMGLSMIKRTATLQILGGEDLPEDTKRIVSSKEIKKLD